MSGAVTAWTVRTTSTTATTTIRLSSGVSGTRMPSEPRPFASQRNVSAFRSLTTGCRPTSCDPLRSQTTLARTTDDRDRHLPRAPLVPAVAGDAGGLRRAEAGALGGMGMTLRWAYSPGYRRPVLLGPAQSDVLRVTLGLTAAGRRPGVTLADLTRRTGRSPSTIHAALRRLRALGLLGVATTMGRRGIHRLWAITAQIGASLDPARQRRAIARMTSDGSRQAPRPDDPPPPPTPPPPPPPPGGLWPDTETFAQKMRRHGLREDLIDGKR